MRPSANCPDCGRLLFRDGKQKASARLAHHKVVGACSPFRPEQPPPKAPRRVIKDTWSFD